MNDREHAIIYGEDELSPRIRKREKSQKFTTAFTWEILYSQAYRKLRPTAQYVVQYGLMQLMQEKKSKLKKTGIRYTNKSGILLEYKELERLLGVNKSTIYRAINQTLAHGFFKLERAGTGIGSASIFNFVNDWHTWKEGDIVSELPKRGNRFKKKVTCRNA